MYHYADGDVSRGPVSRDELRGRITPQTLIWREGMPDWVMAGTLQELSDLFGPAAVVATIDDLEPVPAPAPANAPIEEPRERFPPMVPVATPPLGYGGYGTAQGQVPGLAVASLVLSIVGLMTMCAWFVGLVPSVLAIIFGHIARAQGARGSAPGAALALAGIIMGWIPVALIGAGMALLLLVMIVGAIGGAVS